jgi:hypothetical protein
MAILLARLPIFLYALNTGLIAKTQNAVTGEANGTRRKSFVFKTYTSDLKAYRISM